MYDTALIKQRFSCVEAARQLGLSIRKSGDRCVSPLRKDAANKTSFVVYEQWWYDFGAARGGDVIDLWAELRFDGNRGRAIYDLAVRTGTPQDREDPDTDWMEYTQDLCNRAAWWHSRLTDGDRDYLHARGLTDATIDALLMGRTEEGRLSIPYRKNGYVAYYCTRYLPGGKYPESKYRKQKLDGMCEHVPWGLDTLNREGETLVIAEGAFDAISFWQEGFPVLSAITGNFSREQLPQVLAAARRFKQVLIVYDNDPKTHAGEHFTQRMANILLKARVPFLVGQVPAPYHDISDYYAAGNSLAPIVENAVDGLLHVALQFTEFSQLEQFCYQICRHIKRSRLDGLFSQLEKSNRFSEKAVKLLYKSCTTAPPENIIAGEILRERQLIYIISVGFYEYSSGVWTRIPDETVQSYADQTYGEFSTAQRLSAVCKLLKIRAQENVLFDRQPVWNFINGTLELDTGNFREARPGDYCSFQAKYPYNPQAVCPNWEQFIRDITAGDARAEELLQFIPAYALFHDCPHEKIFVLTGNGGNGKSKYLQLLGELFGEENCSHLPPRALLDKFQIIQLRSSIINLAGEIRSDLRDVEEQMKLIASGEPVSGCYKGEQFVTFRPRTKLVYASNGQLVSGDTSEGLARRLSIVDFKVRFVDNPDPTDPLQKQRDISIARRLSAEIATGGIFNWVYAGYKMLKTVGYFTETRDQEELLQDFKTASDPVILFYEDYAPRESLLSNEQLYSDYRLWCDQNGYKPLNSNWFHRNFRQAAKRDYIPVRTGQGKGYQRRPAGRETAAVDS